MERRLIVVDRNQLPFCDYLREQFAGDRDVEVILDRRWGERRQRVQAHEPERRRADRRQGSPNEADLRTHRFTVIRRKPEAMGRGEIAKRLGTLHAQIVGKRPEDAAGGVHAQASIEEGGPEWQEALKKIGIEGLRLPDNDALCAAWRKFLQELSAGATLGDRAAMPGLVSSMGSADGAAPRGTGASEQTRKAVEMIARENQQRGPNGSEERVKIQAVKPGTGPGPDTVRYLFIVSRDQSEVYTRLTRDFAEDKEVRVILDRRGGERRQRDGRPDAAPARFVPLAKDPISPSTTRADGSSFFSRPKASARAGES